MDELSLGEGGTAFYRLRGRGGIKVWIHRHWEGEDLLGWLWGEMEGRRPDLRVERIPTCKGSRVFRIRLPRGDLYLKHFSYRSPMEVIKALFRGSKGERAWRGGHLLRMLGFQSPPLVALGKRISLLSPPVDFVVTEAVPGLRLKQLLQDGFEKRLAERGWRKKDFLRILALTVADLHRHGIYHGDLNPTNILVDMEGDLSSATFCFLDNARCRQMRKVPYALRLRDLAGLNHPRVPAVSMRDRLRFFSLYRRHLGFQDPKEMVFAIWQRSMRPRKRQATLV
ncbi:MAG: lipopolysaccharide kinase InaA family protein [candidate division NC10 bacterium]|nr:lipopolysaccharide kinase InaA family protein [candidate division NC10 bacterium]